MMMGALPYLHRKGLSITVFATSPVAKLGNQTLLEFIIQKKEFAIFDMFSLKDVQNACANIELVAFDELKKIGDISFCAFPSGSSIGGSCFRFEVHKQTLVYAVDIYDKQSLLTQPFCATRLANTTIMVTNAYLNYNQDGK